MGGFTTFDMTYSYNPQGVWSNQHQMSMNGKHDAFIIEDFKACAKNASMKRGRAETIVQQVQQAILQWQDFASAAGIPPAVAASIAKAHRTESKNNSPALQKIAKQISGFIMRPSI